MKRDIELSLMDDKPLTREEKIHKGKKSFEQRMRSGAVGYLLPLDFVQHAKEELDSLSFRRHSSFLHDMNIDMRDRKLNSSRMKRFKMAAERVHLTKKIYRKEQIQ